jgi:hypothetical protein
MIQVICVHKEFQCGAMKAAVFGKSQGLADKPSQTLPERVVPSLDTIGLHGVFANATMRFFREHFILVITAIKTITTHCYVRYRTDLIYHHGYAEFQKPKMTRLRFDLK